MINEKYNEFYQHFRDNLVANRVRKNLTQEGLALKANISRGYLSQLEAPGCNRAPSFDIYFRLCEVLSLAPDELLKDPKEKAKSYAPLRKNALGTLNNQGQAGYVRESLPALYSCQVVLPELALEFHLLQVEICGRYQLAYGNWPDNPANMSLEHTLQRFAPERNGIRVIQFSQQAIGGFGFVAQSLNEITLQQFFLAEQCLNGATLSLLQRSLFGAFEQVDVINLNWVIPLAYEKTLRAQLEPEQILTVTQVNEQLNDYTLRLVRPEKPVPRRDAKRK